jgi:hypothetical protein
MHWLEILLMKLVKETGAFLLMQSVRTTAEQIWVDPMRQDRQRKVQQLQFGWQQESLKLEKIRPDFFGKTKL